MPTTAQPAQGLTPADAYPAPGLTIIVLNHLRPALQSALANGGASWRLLHAPGRMPAGILDLTALALRSANLKPT